jgi:hypothetical protein
MTSASGKDHEERITEAVCAADFHAKFDQILLQYQGRQRAFLKLKRQWSTQLSGGAAGSLSALAEIQIESSERCFELNDPTLFAVR